MSIYTGKIRFPQPNEPIAYIVNGKAYPTDSYRNYLKDMYRNTRAGDTALNGLLSNANLSESGTTVTLVTGSTLVIAGTINITGNFQIDGVTTTITATELEYFTEVTTPTNGQLLVGRTVDSKFLTTSLVDGVALTKTVGAGTLQLDADLATTTTVGVASFLASDFNVSVGGEVSLNAVGNNSFYSFSISFSDLAAAGTKILINSSGTERYKVREIFITGKGTAFNALGNRRINIQDSSGTTVYTVIPKIALTSLSTTRWGQSIDCPFPTTSFDMDEATVAGEDLIATYSGGTTDYTSGALNIILNIERVS